MVSKVNLTLSGQGVYNVYSLHVRAMCYITEQYNMYYIVCAHDSWGNGKWQLTVTGWLATYLFKFKYNLDIYVFDNYCQLPSKAKSEDLNTVLESRNYPQNILLDPTGLSTNTVVDYLYHILFCVYICGHDQIIEL